MKQLIAAAVAFSFLATPAAFAAQGLLPIKQEQKAKDKKTPAAKKAAPKPEANQAKGPDKKDDKRK